MVLDRNEREKKAYIVRRKGCDSNGQYILVMTYIILYYDGMECYLLHQITLRRSQTNESSWTYSTISMFCSVDVGV